MKTFKEYIMEDSSYKKTDLSDLEKRVDKHLEDKLISNKDYDILKGSAGRRIQKASTDAKNYFKTLVDVQSQIYDDVFWSTVAYSSNDVLNMKKKIEGLETKYGKEEPIIKAARQFFEDTYPLAQKIKELKQHVVPVSELKKREAEVKKEEERKAATTKFSGPSGSLIDILLKETKPLYDEFMAQTKKWVENDAIRYMRMSQRSYEQWKQYDGGYNRHGLSAATERVRNQAHKVSSLGCTCLYRFGYEIS